MLYNNIIHSGASLRRKEQRDGLSACSRFSRPCLLGVPGGWRGVTAGTGPAPRGSASATLPEMGRLLAALAPATSRARTQRHRWINSASAHNSITCECDKMTLFIHLYCVIWIAILTACSSTTGELKVQLAFLLSSSGTCKSYNKTPLFHRFCEVVYIVAQLL